MPPEGLCERRPDPDTEITGKQATGATPRSGFVHCTLSELCAVISDSVNVGARLENLCKRFGVGVLASQEALDACPDPARFPHRCLGDQQLRGKARSVRIYEVFAYEDPAVVEAKLETREQFEEAVRLLSGPHGGADAFVLLRQLQRKLPDDPVTGLLLQKAAQSVTGAF